MCQPIYKSHLKGGGGSRILGELNKKVALFTHICHMMVMKVQGRRKRGKPKRRWFDKVKDNIKEKGLSADDVYDRATWRRMSSYIDTT